MEDLNDIVLASEKKIPVFEEINSKFHKLDSRLE